MRLPDDREGSRCGARPHRGSFLYGPRGAGIAAALAAVLLPFAASCGGSEAAGEEPFRVIARDAESKQVQILVMGRSESAPPIDWRPPDTREVTPRGLPARAVLRFQIPTAGTAEVRARIEDRYRGYEMSWVQPATVTVEARVIDEINRRVVKQLKRNEPGGDSFVYNEHGFDFNFVLGDEDLAIAEPGGGIFDRLYAAKGEVGIAIEVTAFFDGERAPEMIRFRLDEMLD